MDYQVNTEEIRRAARQIREIAADVKSLSAQRVRGMQSGVRENLTGETAEAAYDMLASLAADISRIGAGLDAVQSTLSEYADRVEAADEKISQMIKD